MAQVFLFSFFFSPSSIVASAAICKLRSDIAAEVLYDTFYTDDCKIRDFCIVKFERESIPRTMFLRNRSNTIFRRKKTEKLSFLSILDIYTTEFQNDIFLDRKKERGMINSSKGNKKFERNRKPIEWKVTSRGPILSHRSQTIAPFFFLQGLYP